MMKLCEITSVSSIGNISIGELKLLDKTPVAVIAPSVKMYYSKDENGDYYTLHNTDNEFIGVLGGRKFFYSVVGSEVFVAHTVKVLPEYLGNNYGGLLYKYVFKYLGIPILSDDKQTPSGKKLWKKFVELYPEKVLVVDTKTNAILDYNDVGYNDIYTGTRFRLLLTNEHSSQLENINLLGNSIIFEYIGDENERIL